MWCVWWIYFYQIHSLTLHISLQKTCAAISRLRNFIFEILQSENATLEETRNIIISCFYLRIFAGFCFCFLGVFVFLLHSCFSVSAVYTGLVHSVFLFSNWQTSYEAAVGMNWIGRVVSRDIECNNCEPSDKQVWKLVGSQHDILMKLMKTKLSFVILLKWQLICQCLGYIFIRKTIITYVATQHIVILLC